jgi:hypothetical protein
MALANIAPSSKPTTCAGDAAMNFEVNDADGNVTETWEQIAQRLDEPARWRPLLTPFLPQDGGNVRQLSHVS